MSSEGQSGASRTSSRGEDLSAAIRIQGLGKQYRIGQSRTSYRTLREAISDAALAPIRRIRSFGQASYRQQDSIWALRDINLEIPEGEVMGLIGSNGAGKSTLLKILARIVEPTTGHAKLRGRVGSLLEVGTGFHPELTGRENVFLSGAILGMPRSEIRNRFDQIVEFSGVRGFIDTPVKRYSSGMAVRLGFAVAAHLDPDILLVDEVLSVGDEAFRARSLRRMHGVAQSGRTVVFVSHNVSAITRLCTDCLWLDGGRMAMRGSPRDVVGAYVSSVGASQSTGEIGEDMHAHEPRGLAFKWVSVGENENGEPQSAQNTNVRVESRFEVTEALHEVVLGVVIRAIESDTIVCCSHSTDGPGPRRLVLNPGMHNASVELPLPLMPGEYWIDLFAKLAPGHWGSNHPSLDWVQHAARLLVTADAAQAHGSARTGAIVRCSGQWAVASGSDVSRVGDEHS